MAAQMPVEQLALVPYSFPTYANALGRAAIGAAIELDQTGKWAVDHLADVEQIAGELRSAAAPDPTRGGDGVVRSSSP